MDRGSLCCVHLKEGIVRGVGIDVAAGSGAVSITVGGKNGGDAEDDADQGCGDYQ